MIALLTPKDSILYKFTRSDAEGKYILKDVKPGKLYFNDYPSLLMLTVLEDVEIKGDTEFPPYKSYFQSKIIAGSDSKNREPFKNKR